MGLAAVSRYATNSFNSVQGMTKGEKLTHLAKCALNLTTAALLYRVSPERVKTLIPYSAFLTYLTSSPHFVVKLILSLGIVEQIQECRLKAGQLSSSANLSSNVVFFATAFVACRTAYQFFNRIVYSPENCKDPVVQKKEYNTTFEDHLLSKISHFLILATSLGLHLSYAPYTTLCGLGLGIFIRESCHYLSFGEFKEMIYSFSPLLSSMDKTLSTPLERFYNDVRSTENHHPLPLNELPSLLWTNWNNFASAVSSNPGAMIKGFNLENQLASYFHLSHLRKETPDPTETAHEAPWNDAEGTDLQ